jgi:hypothetical protein
MRAGDGTAKVQLVGVAVLAFDGPYARLVFLEGVDVHHPVEDHGMERAARRGAGLLRGDRSP